MLGLFFVTNPIGIAITAITLLAGLFIVLYNNSETFRTAVQNAFEKVKEAASMALDFLKTNWPLILAILTGPLGLAVLAITKNWDTIVSTIKGLPGRIRAAATGLWDGIKEAFKSVINFIIGAWNKLQFKVPSFSFAGKTIGGFTLGLPPITPLARGGVVMPSAGGTLAQIGEAGRAERVEPLDSNGLSKRDKAMIETLAGGKGSGINITINPSAGMDERELASIVSRQIAFQLRKGAA